MRPLGLLCSLPLLLTPLARAEETPAPSRLTPVASGGGLEVYAAFQPAEGRFDDSNSAVIVTPSEVLVVDSQASLAGTREVLASIRAVTEKPVRYLVNTHWHGDHTAGNRIYLEAFPGLEIVAQPTVAEDLAARAEPDRREQIEAYTKAIFEAEERFLAGLDREGQPLDRAGRRALMSAIGRARGKLAELHEVRDAPPTMTFGDRLLLHRGESTIQLMGFRAHTRGDTVVYLPQQKVLITGDLLDDLPFAGHGYPREWIATLDTLEALDFDTVIPGHGPILRGKEKLRLVRELLASAREQAARAVEAGKDLETARAEADFASFRERFAGSDPVAERNFDAFLPGLVERAWLEARGQIE